MTTAAARAAIHEGIAADIRRVSVAHRVVTLDVALANWEHFFQAGRYTEARIWWAVAARLMSN